MHGGFVKDSLLRAGPRGEDEVEDHERDDRVRFSNSLQDVGGNVDPVIEVQPRLVAVVTFFSKAVGNSEIEGACKGPNMAKSLCELDRLAGGIALNGFSV